MSGILATNRKIIDLPNVIEYLKFRGPDQTNQVKVNGVNFVLESRGHRKYLFIGRGVVQGDTMGPLMFLLVYHSFLLYFRSSKPHGTTEDLQACLTEFNKEGVFIG